MERTSSEVHDIRLFKRREKPFRKSLLSEYTQVRPRNGAAHTTATRHIWKRILNKDLSLSLSLSVASRLFKRICSQGSQCSLHVFRSYATHFAQCLRGSSVDDRRKVTRIISFELSLLNSARILVNEKSPCRV